MSTVNLVSRSQVALTGFIALCCALFLAVMMSAAPVSGDTRSLDPDLVTAIEIHKFEHPVTPGSPADGLPRDTSGLTPVPGATYTAKRVPGIDLTANSGQLEAARISLGEAAGRITGVEDSATAVTDGDGRATLAGLGVGVYYVQEAVIPEGYAGASPFLIALPLTHPESGDSWLTTVHVYPKSSRVGIDLSVVDQDAVVIGDTVRWTSRSGIPLTSSLTGYRVDLIINPQLSLVGGTGNEAGSVSVTIDTGAPEPGEVRFVTFVSQADTTPLLRAGVDYTTSYSAANRTLQVLFLEPGLRKLEQAIAANPTALVRIEYDTTVGGEGALMNEAVLYPSQYAIDSGVGIRDGAVTKWGPLSVIVKQSGDGSQPVAGAVFELYATPQDAFARRNPITADGVSRWVTDDQGRLVINGLRFSGFANGLDRETSDPLFRDYWVVPVSLPDGWSWVDQQPTSGIVNSDLNFQAVTYLVKQHPDGSDPDDDSEGSDGSTLDKLLADLAAALRGFEVTIGSAVGGTTTPGTPGPTPEPQPGTVAGSQPGEQLDTQPEASAGQGALASTGAQVLGLVMFGLVLMVAGTLLVLGRRRRNEEVVES